MRTLLFPAIAISLLTSACATRRATVNTIPGYKLVWSDEFNKDGRPDSTNWTYEKGFVRNHELQWYQPENARCEKGLLIIEAKREQRPNPNYEANSQDWKKNRATIDYTSACLITRGLHQWQYGRFEMRGRIDVSPGMWPAWWALGVQKRWPANGEIDMMEYYRGMILANFVHLGENGKQKWYTVTKKLEELGDASWATKFHTWRMDWDADSLALYVDDILLNKVMQADLYNRDGSNFKPFQQPQYMLLNLALGGDNGGTPNDASFPHRFEVDYVRVYQKQ